jgi:hypothetical protein
LEALGIIRGMDAPHVDLPELVRRYLARSLQGDRPPPRQVRITQEGEMWQKPGGRAMRFSAGQRFAVDRVAFSWQARFPIIGPLAIHVIDDYAAGAGKLEVRLLGIPVQRQRGRETVRGEALRYLAELAWAPHAIASNRELDWRRLDNGRAEVATEIDGERLAVEVEFDGAGDIVRTRSQMRLIRIEKRWVPRPWGGAFGEYARLGGIRIPTEAEAYWDLEQGRFIYWRGRVTSAELLDEPFVRESAR